MKYGGEPISRFGHAPEYRPAHDLPEVDVDAWSVQWWSCLAALDPESAKYREAERFIAAQLGLHPAVRGVDAEDLSFVMESLTLVGSENPYDKESDSVLERGLHKEWQKFWRLARLFGRQIVRDTLKDSEDYVRLRMEQEYAGTDYLTGMLNRRGLARKLAESYGIGHEPDEPESQGPRRGEDLPANVTHFYGDGNMLGWIDKNLGHHIGDAAIVEASWNFAGLFRESDAPIFYRFGGDEFGAILVGLDVDEASRLAGRTSISQLRKAMSNEHYDSMNRLRYKLREVARAGERLRVEAQPERLTESQVFEGQHPRHTIYINGEAITELDNLITLAIGAASGPAYNFDDIERMRQMAEADMQKDKQVFHVILSDYYD